MMELSSRFQLNTKHCCFICLREVPYSKSVGPWDEGKVTRGMEGKKSRTRGRESLPPETFSLYNLCHYLKLNLAKILSRRVSLPSIPIPKSVLSFEWSDVRVVMCGSCRGVVVKFSKLLKELAKLRMEVHHCLEEIQKWIGDSDKDALRVNQFHKLMASDIQSLVFLKIVDELRKEVSKKCSVAAASAQPRVKLEKLGKKLLQKKMKSKIIKVPISRSSLAAANAQPKVILERLRSPQNKIKPDIVQLKTSEPHGSHRQKSKEDSKLAHSPSLTESGAHSVTRRHSKRRRSPSPIPILARVPEMMANVQVSQSRIQETTSTSQPTGTANVANCEFCQKGFISLEGLNKHFAAVHPLFTQTPLGGNPESLMVSDHNKIDSVAKSNSIENINLHIFQTEAGRIKDIKTSLEAARSRNMDLETNLEAERFINRVIEINLKEARSQRRDLETKLEATRSGNRDLETILEAGRSRKRDLETKLEATRSRNRNMETHLEAYHIRSRGLEANLEAARSRNRNMEINLEAAGSRKRDLETKLEAAHSRNRGLEANLEAARSRNRGLETNLEAVPSTHMNLETNLEAAHSRNRDLVTTPAPCKINQVLQITSATTKPVDGPVKVVYVGQRPLIVPTPSDSTSEKKQFLSVGPPPLSKNRDCKHCGKTFDSVCVLKRHINSEHKKTRELPSNEQFISPIRIAPKPNNHPVLASLSGTGNEEQGMDDDGDPEIEIAYVELPSSTSNKGSAQNVSSHSADPLSDVSMSEIMEISSNFTRFGTSESQMQVAPAGGPSTVPLLQVLNPNAPSNTLPTATTVHAHTHNPTVHVGGPPTFNLNNPTDPFPSTFQVLSAPQISVLQVQPNLSGPPTLQLYNQQGPPTIQLINLPVQSTVQALNQPNEEVRLSAPATSSSLSASGSSCHRPAPAAKASLNFQTYRCRLCGREFIDRNVFQCHYNAEHLDLPFACNQCGKMFAEDVHLREHFRKFHDSGAPVSFILPREMRHVQKWME